MRQIIINESKEKEIRLSEISEHDPIFAKNKEGKLCGMIVYEDEGWILKIGGSYGATGYHKTRQDCLQSCLIHGYTFFVED